MGTVIDYFASNQVGFNNILIFVIILSMLVAGMIKCFDVIHNLATKWYAKKRGDEEETEQICEQKEDIKQLTESINNLGNLLNKQYTHLEKKIDEQKTQLENKLDDQREQLEKKIDGQKEHLEEAVSHQKSIDRSMIRDRLREGLRYFEKNQIDGVVHISLIDHENMESLFQSYFDCLGNGTFKKIYENEFSKWVIDK